MLGINQSKNAHSSASTDSHDDSSAYSHNTDQSVGANANGPVDASTHAYNASTQAGAGSTVNVTDGGAVGQALAFADSVVRRVTEGGASQSQSGTGSVESYGGASSASGGLSSVPWWAWLVGGLVLVGGVVLVVKKGKNK